MTPTPLLGMLCGVVIAAGLILLAVGAYGSVPEPPAERVTGQGANRYRINTRGLVVALSVGVALAAFTGWWSLAWLSAVGGVVLPAMSAERVGQVRSRARVAAVASWVETVRDLLSAASGIEEAITRSADTLAVSSPIRDEVLRLRAITAMGGLREGLRRFGTELADPTVDYVCATLLIAAERSSGVLHEQLSEAAIVAREQVSVRERVEASRSRMRTAASAIAAVTLVMAVFIIGTQPSYATWYRSVTGQTVLCVSGTIELVGLWWMARLARPEPGTRIVLEATRHGDTFGGFPA